MSKIVLFLANKDNVLYNFRSEVILRIKDLGYEVVLCCPYGKKIDFFTKRGCKFIHIDIDRRGTSLVKDIHLISRYNRIFKKIKPDIVLTYTSKPSIYGGFLCGIMNIPCIINNAGLMEVSGPFEIFMKFLYKLGFSKASCIMYQNNRERDYVNKIVGNKVHFRDIPGSGVNLSHFSYKEYPCNDDLIIFNYVARIVKFKGIDELIECAKIIKQKYNNVHFVIFGDFDDEHYRVKIKELEKKGILEYGGVQVDMKPFIAAAHAAIHPSYYEGMTNVVLEHSSMGRPCIGSNIPGVKEGIDDGKTGFLFEPKNVGSMVEAVEKFLSLTHDEKSCMGIQARLKMEREFSRDIVIDAYLEEIRKNIGKA